MAVWKLEQTDSGSVDRVDGAGFDAWDMRGEYVDQAPTAAQAWMLIHQANSDRYGIEQTVYGEEE